MIYEIKSELEDLKEMASEQTIKTGNFYTFLDVCDYQDDYSGNEILEMQEELFYHAKKYLKENHNGKYVIKKGIYAVILITKEHFDKYIDCKCGWEIC